MEEGKKKGKGGRENCVYFIKIPASYKHKLTLNVIVIEKLLYSIWDKLFNAGWYGWGFKNRFKKLRKQKVYKE